MTTLFLQLKLATLRAKRALGLVSGSQNHSGNLVWEGSFKEDASCCRVVWVLKE